MAGIKIGENAHLRDNVVVHVDYDMPTVIGKNVVVGMASCWL